MILIIAALSGLVFAYGLVRSGMVEPQRVIGFLDITGNWDPSLAFVMAGAVLIGLLLMPLVKKMPQPIWESRWHLPTRKAVDLDLILGSVVFGIGWGIVGICPGPALVNLARFESKNFAFVGAMLVGMLAYRCSAPFLDKLFKREV